MAIYLLLKIAKFVAVLAYAGSLCAAFVTRDVEQHRVLVHRLASPALLLVWLAGYGLTLVMNVPLTELWVLGGLVLSLTSQLALVFSAAKGRQDKVTLAWATLPLAFVVVLMVVKPTWHGLFG